MTLEKFKYLYLTLPISADQAQAVVRYCFISARRSS